MAKHITTIENLGETACWLLVQQALGMADAKTQSDYMQDKVAMLLFAKKSLPERLCVTAAVRQMSGTTIFQGEENSIWREEIHVFQEHLLPIFGYYLDVLYLYGFSMKDLEKGEDLAFPTINAGGQDAHPAHALADVACMLRVSKDLRQDKAAWIGCDNGTLHSLMACTLWFHFNLSISLPPHIDKEPLIRKAREYRTHITFEEDPEKAAAGARFIYAGRRSQSKDDQLQSWRVTPRLMSHARPDARLLLSASPMRAIDISPEVLKGKSLLTRQAEYRLRVHKRILHLVFEGK